MLSLFTDIAHERITTALYLFAAVEIAAAKSRGEGAPVASDEAEWRENPCGRPVPAFRILN